MTNLLSSWRVLTSWRIDNIMTCLWHDTFWMWQTFWRYDECHTYWCHDKHFHDMELFDNMTHCLTSWRTFLRNVELYDVMVFFTFCWHDVFLTPWPAFYRLDFFFSLFQEQNIMKTCFWYYDKLWDVMIYVSCYDELFDVMTCFCLHDKLFNIRTYFWFYDTLFDIMIYFLLHDKFVTSWQTFWPHGVFLMSWPTLWRHDELGDIMTNFVTSLRFHVFFTSCQTFRRNDELFKIIMKLLTSWRTLWHHGELFDIMTCLWHYDEFLMWQTIWCHDICWLIDVITIILTPETFWQHDILTHFLTSWLTFSLHFCRSDCILSLFRE